MTSTTSTTSFIDIGHTEVAYERIGSGPDLVFIHGWPLHRDTWRDVVAGLDGYTCHLFDLPGAGQSKATDETPLNLRGHAASISAVIDELGLERFSLVGHDSGAMFARMVAAERSEQVEALVLAGTEIPDHHPWQVAMFSLLAKLPASDNVLRMMLKHDVLAYSPMALGGCFSDNDRISPRFGAMLADLLDDPDVTRSQMTLIKNFDTDVVNGLAEVHGRLTMPSLLIWGEDDPFFPVDKARAMTAQFAGPTTFDTVPDARLFVHEEHPERFARSAKAFLDEHVAATERG